MKIMSLGKLAVLSLVTLNGFTLVDGVIAFAAPVGKLRMPVVSRYELSGQRQLFKQADPLEIPMELIETVEIETPDRAMTGEFPHVFLQNHRVAVCWKDCSGAQMLTRRFDPNTGDTEVYFLHEEKDRKKKRLIDQAVLRQTTVYYWVNRLMDQFEQMGHEFKRPLKIYVDREAVDPDFGTEIVNNAFFLDTQIDLVDWSLSFLPSDNSLKYRIALGGKSLDTGYDPSVAMHEATHFVFQEIIGKVLNQEVFGLHEAFADYFAMAVLNSPEIGRVFLRGRPLRSAAGLLKYKSGMEAHDLGNVVASALWNIRTLFDSQDHARVDRVAFQVIRRLSNDPYASAGSVVQAYLDELDQEFPTVGVQTRNRIVEVWEATNLRVEGIDTQAEITRIPLSDEETRSLVTLSLRQEYPKSAVIDWGVKPVEVMTLTVGPSRPGPVLPAGEGEPPRSTEWIRVVHQELTGELPVATPIWIHLEAKSKRILEARDYLGRKVTPRDDRLFLRLAQIASVLGEVSEYTSKFGAEVLSLLKGASWSDVKARKIRSAQSVLAFSFGEELFSMTEYTLRTRPTLIGRIRGWIGDPTARSIEEVKLFLVPDAELSDARLPAIRRSPAGGLDRLVGYQIKRKTGSTYSIRLIHRNQR